MSNLMDQLKEQKKLEQIHAKALKPSVAKAQNKLVAELLESMLLDSMRHATVLQALADVKAGEMSTSSNIDTAVADLHQIREHIKVEAEMLSKVGVMAREAKERHVKSVLQSILEDEKKHHSTLQALSNMMERDSTTVGGYLELLQKYMAIQK